jgi:murein DD-endopeptidase MepM/ murein hydrolase activator NlpD
MRFGFEKPARRQPGIMMALAIAAAAGGCSADVSRFDFPASLSLNDSPGATGAISTPADAGPADRSNLIGEESGNGQAYFPPQKPRNDNVSMSTLPDATPNEPAPSRYAAAEPAPSSTAAPAWPVDQSPSQSAPPTAALPYGTMANQPAYQAPASDRGEMIEVRPGDTLYGLSKRHKVSLTELMAVNDLKGPALKPGQKLYLPSSNGTAGSRAPSAELAGRPAEPSIPVAEAPANWTGSYVIRQGDSVYAVARRFNVKPAELQRYNGITDVRKVKPGTVLKMPASAGAQVAANGATQTDAPPPAGTEPAAPRVVVTPPQNSAPPSQPTILNAPGNDNPGASTLQVAVNTPTSGTAAADPSKLRWPVQGKVISGFGQRPDGTHNDGVNLAVPMGTEVHAAESGVVAYAGNELKGYGNLILLRHDNGWVTAYAHSEDLLVKRGDKVKRGQVIAKAGKTGQVDQPQVHFELRQGQRPVDPTPFMEKL